MESRVIPVHGVIYDYSRPYPRLSHFCGLLSTSRILPCVREGLPVTEYGRVHFVGHRGRSEVPPIPNGDALGWRPRHGRIRSSPSEFLVKDFKRRYERDSAGRAIGGDSGTVQSPVPCPKSGTNPVTREI